MKIFEEELIKLIDRYLMKNKSDTPDFILAKYMKGCLGLFNKAMKQRKIGQNTKNNN